MALGSRALAIFVALLVASPAASADRRKARSTTAAATQRRSAAADNPRARIVNEAPRGETELDRALQAELDRLLADSALKSAINGIYIVEPRSGKVLYSYAADRQIDPASNTKLISTATAFDALGPEFTFKTRLVGPAPDADGVVHGDVWILGAADPLLATDDLMDLGNGLVAAGVKKITGDVVIGDDEERDAVARPAVDVTVRGGERDGAPVEVAIHPDTGLFVVESSARTSASARRTKLQVSLEPVRKNGQQKIRVAVSGLLHPGQTADVERNVPHPLLYTAHTVRGYAVLAGVEIVGGVRQGAAGGPGAGAVDLAVHRSVPLSRLAALINKPSDNFLADRLITTVGSELYGGERNMQKGVKAMSAWLDKVGIPTGSYRLENGSGLSHTIHVSARQIAQVLLHGSKDDRFGTAWVDSFAVGGQDGTLLRRFLGRASAGFVRGKTGTLDGVATLSGFVYAPQGEDAICFSILTEGFRPGRKGAIRAGQADMVDAIFAYLVARRTGGTEVKPAVPAATPAPGDDRGDSDDDEAASPAP